MPNLLSAKVFALLCALGAYSPDQCKPAPPVKPHENVLPMREGVFVVEKQILLGKE
jgi:hypothetical protein